MFNHYELGFILDSYEENCETIKNSLVEFGQEIMIEEMACDGQKEIKSFRIQLRCMDPTVIFDLCGQLGKIRQVRVNEKMGG